MYKKCMTHAQCHIFQWLFIVVHFRWKVIPCSFPVVVTCHVTVWCFLSASVCSHCCAQIVITNTPWRHNQRRMRLLSLLIMFKRAISMALQVAMSACHPAAIWSIHGFRPEWSIWTTAGGLEGLTWRGADLNFFVQTLMIPRGWIWLALVTPSQLFLKCHREIWSEMSRKPLEGFAVKFVPHVWVHCRMNPYNSGDPLTFPSAPATAVTRTDPLIDCGLRDLQPTLASVLGGMWTICSSHRQFLIFILTISFMDFDPLKYIRIVRRSTSLYGAIHSLTCLYGHLVD